MAIKTSCTTSVPVNSYLSRRLLRGYHEEIINKIAGEFGVRINAKTSDKAIVTIKGPTPTAIEVVQGLITELDQKAGVIVNKYDIKCKQDIGGEHYNLMRGHLETLMPQARRKLNALQHVADSEQVEHKTSASKRQPSPATPQKDTSQFFEKAEDAASVGARKGKNNGSTVVFTSEFMPRNMSQAITYLACKDPAVSLVFAAGPFGGGKTYTPLRAAFEAVREGRVDEIIIIRPPTTSGKHNPGAMPGNARQKIDPYVKGGVDSNIVKITGKPMAHFEKAKVLRALTPEFERGETYDHAFIVVDEPQNLTMAQAELLIGRLGEGSVMAFAGDIGGNQNDLHGEMPGLAHLIATQGAAAKTDRILDRAAAFIAFKPEDSAARNGILPHVAKALNEPPAEYAGYMQTIREARRDFHLAQAIDKAREYSVSILKEAAERTFARYEERAHERFPRLRTGNVVSIAGLDRKHG